MRPRRALISAYFDPALPGGGSQYSVDMVREWIHRGMDVHVLCSDHPRKLGDLEKEIEAHHLILHPILDANRLLISHRFDSALRAKASRLFVELNPESIHIHNFHGMLGAVQAAVESPSKTVYTALDFGLVCPSWYLYDGSTTPCSGPEPSKCRDCLVRQLPIPWKKRMLGHAPDWFLQVIGKPAGYFKQYAMLPHYYEETADYLPKMLSLLPRFDQVLTISPVMGRILAQFGVPHERIHCTVQGADFPATQETTRPEKLRLIFLGHSAPIKGFQVVAEAAALLPDDLKLEIQAYGSDMAAAMERLPAAACRYIVISRTLIGAEVDAELASADALVIPSLWHENTPYAVLRALAASRPVIGSRHEGISHLITEGRNGFLLPPGDVDAWKTMLLKVTQNPSILREMRPHCYYRKTVKEYADEVEQYA